MTTTARYYHTEQVHYLRKDVNYATPNIATAGMVSLGKIPANAVVLRVMVGVTTVFNAATTNVLTVGTAGAASALVDAAGTGTSADESTVGVYTCKPATLAGLLSASAETELFVQYTQSGTAATTGAAWIVVEYAPAEV